MSEEREAAASQRQPGSQPGPGDMPVPELDLQRLDFRYTKSPSFRTIIASGIFGGVLPPGSIQLSFWSEYHPFPERVSHVIVNGVVGPELPGQQVQPDGFQREVEVNVILDLDVAMVLRQWLDVQILRSLDQRQQLQQLRTHTSPWQRPGMQPGVPSERPPQASETAGDRTSEGEAPAGTQGPGAE